MCWTSLRRVLMTCCAAAALLSTPTRSWAACALWDWMFGSGQTTYAPPYCPPNISTATAPACGCAPAQPACGCAAVQPACQPCVPTATYRISYRPVPTVAYMPVVSIDPCSGCAVTTYRPTQTWTYRASLVPYPTYQVGYAPVAVGGCGSCGGCAPCSGYSSSYGGCSSCADGRLRRLCLVGRMLIVCHAFRPVDQYFVTGARRHEWAAGYVLAIDRGIGAHDQWFTGCDAGGPRYFIRVAPHLRPQYSCAPDLTECARCRRFALRHVLSRSGVQRGQPHCRTAEDPGHPASSQQSQRSATSPSALATS